jgi:glycosyltransferase involved in cell wall biosynthesis
LVETLCSGGHRVDLLTFHLGQDIEMEGLRVLRIPALPFIRYVPPGFSLRKLACDLVLCLSLAARLLRGRYDVVHAVEESVFPALLFNLGSKRRLVYDMDSSLADQVLEKWTWLRILARPLGWFECLAARHADLVLAVCPRLADKVRDCDPLQTVVVLEDVPMNAGRDTTEESLRAEGEEAAVVALYVGNLEHYQGVDLLLEACAQVPATEPLRLVLIGGETGHVEHYQRMAERLGIASRTRFLGPRPLAQLGAYLAQADILVSPRSKGVNTPMKLYSYLASGRAVLATDIVSHTQVLDDNSALLVAPTAAAIAAGLQRLVGDPQLRDRLGRQGAELARREYTPQAYRAKLRAAYQRLQPAGVSRA